MGKCRCERVSVLRRSGRVVDVLGVISEDCPVHFVRERKTWHGLVSARLPVGKYARCVEQHRVRRYFRFDGSIVKTRVVSTRRKETPAETQRRLHREALA